MQQCGRYDALVLPGIGRRVCAPSVTVWREARQSLNGHFRSPSHWATDFVSSTDRPICLSVDLNLNLCHFHSVCGLTVFANTFCDHKQRCFARQIQDLIFKLVYYQFIFREAPDTVCAVPMWCSFSLPKCFFLICKYYLTKAWSHFPNVSLLTHLFPISRHLNVLTLTFFNKGAPYHSFYFTFGSAQKAVWVSVRCCLCWLQT